VEDRDIFVVYLSLKPGAFNEDLAYIDTDVEGYYEARTFYSPDYDQKNDPGHDTRRTLHWEPGIITDDNGKATVSFWNADAAASIRIDVQGITGNGVPVTKSIQYEVK
jgi:hypothetical protein